MARMDPDAKNQNIAPCYGNNVTARLIRPPRSQWTVHTRDLHSQPIGINCINEKWCNWAQPSKVARAERSRMTGVTVMKPSPGQPDEPCDARPRSQISICKCTFTQRHTQHACIYVCVFRHVTYPHNRHDRCRKNRQTNMWHGVVDKHKRKKRLSILCRQTCMVTLNHTIHVRQFLSENKVWSSHCVTVYHTLCSLHHNIEKKEQRTDLDPCTLHKINVHLYTGRLLKPPLRFSTTIVYIPWPTTIISTS